MPDEVGPAVRRRQLSRQLRELRTAAGFVTMDAAAAATGLSRATISRIESAKQVILPRTVRLLCQIYGIGSPTLDQMLRLAEESGDDRGWQSEYADTVPAWFERYVEEESDATEMWTYEAELVPGLLRTPEYIRAVRLASEPDTSREVLDRSVAFLLARQERLTAKRGPKFLAVVNEAVVHRQVGGPEVMSAQLRHLVQMCARPNVTVQVLPFAVGAHAAMAGSFMMLRFPPSTGVATIFVETDSYGMYRDKPAEFERYDWIFGRLRAQALDPVKSLALLENMAHATERVN